MEIKNAIKFEICDSNEFFFLNFIKYYFLQEYEISKWQRRSRK